MNGVAGPKAPVAKYGQPVAPNLSVHHLCPNCQTSPPNIIEEYSHGDLVCADCGTILGDRIVDTRSEWRTFAGDEGGDDPSRVGGPSNPLLANASLDTTISARDGRTGMSRDLQRAQSRANAQANSPGGRSNAQLENAFARISELCAQTHLPKSIAERAQHAYKIGDEARVARGRNDRALIAASIILATRAAKVTRGIGEVARTAQVSKSEAGKTFNLLKAAYRDYQARKGELQPEGLSSANESVEGLLGRICNFVDLGKNHNQVYNAALYIAKNAANKATIDGRSPVSIAAGVVFLTATLFSVPLTAKDIAKVADVSESTIKMIGKKIASVLDDVIQPEWKDLHKEGYQSLLTFARLSPARPSRSGTPSVSTPTVTPSA